MAIVPVRCLLPALLRERRKTAQQLAEETGIAKQQISDYANTRIIMSLKTAKTIAEVLEVPIDDLYIWADEPPSRKVTGKKQSSS